MTRPARWVVHPHVWMADVDSVVGFSIKSREIVQQYFEPHFERLWSP